MASTYQVIATSTLTSTATEVIFSSIPSTYTDLILTVDAALTASAADLAFQVNSDSGLNYSYINLYEYSTSSVGTTATSNYSSGFFNTAGAIDAQRSFYRAEFMNYSNTTTKKSVYGRATNTARGTDLIVNMWASTAAINSIRVFTGASTFIVGSVFTIYGIKAA